MVQLRRLKQRPAVDRPLGHTSDLRTGVTLVEMTMVLMCVVVLMALLLQAVSASREKSRLAVCQSNLKQMGVALLDYHNIHREFPGGCDATGDRRTSWCTVLLPLLEQAELFERYHPKLAWNAEENRVVTETRLSIFQCPATVHEAPAQGDYSGNMGTTLTGLPEGYRAGSGWRSGVLLRVHDAKYAPEQSAVSLGQVRDGATMTFLVLECSGIPAQMAGSWADGDHCMAHDRPSINLHLQHPFKRIHEIGSDHPGGANSLMCDAGARFIGQGIDSKVLGALCTRGGRERMTNQSFE